jgi:hypothetical protein
VYLDLGFLALHILLALWATRRALRVSRWLGSRRNLAWAFGWLIPVFGPIMVLAATMGTAGGQPGNPDLRNSVEQLRVGGHPDDP